MPTKSVLTTYSTDLSVNEVMNRLEKILQEKNISIFARISHSDAAHKLGLTMQNEELLIFGNPKAGTPLMLESPAIGIELPLKIIAWNENQRTIVGLQNVDNLAKDYQIEENSNIIKLMKSFLIELVESAIKVE